jgi:hypothetical protein
MAMLRSKFGPEEQERFVRAVRAMTGQGEEAGYEERVNRILLEVWSRLERSGVKLLLTNSPLVLVKEPRYKIEGLPQSVPILDFRDPGRFPELYRLDNRFDWGHLNGEGALIYTKLLARSFAPFMRK